MATERHVLGCSGTYAGPGRRVQRLPRARRRHERLGRLRARARWPTSSSTSPRRRSTRSSSATPSRPLARAAGAAQRVEVRLRASRACRCTRHGRDARAASTSCAATSSEPTFDWDDRSPTVDRVDDRRPRLHVRRDRPSGRDARGAHRAPDGRVAASTRPTPGRSGRSTRSATTLDLALCEATLLAEDRGHVHRTSRRARRASRRGDAGVRRLVLTHLWPDLDPRAPRRTRRPRHSVEASTSPCPA